MSITDYRVYIRTSVAPFDGASAETATYSGTRFRYTTTSTGAVGRWSPANLGRSNIASLVQVFSDSAASSGDIVQVLASTGVVRTTATYQPSGSGWLFLEPDDTLTITAAASTQCEIVVNDLQDDQLLEYIVGQEIAASSQPTFTSVTMSASGTVPAVNGELVVFLNPAAAATITLPALADVPESSGITFIRVSGAGLPTIVPNGLADQVNGSSAVTYTPYFMRSLQDSVRYVRVPSGWVRSQGNSVLELISSALDPIVVPCFPEGTQYVLSTGAVGQQIQLADLSLGRPGYRIVVQNGSANAHSIVPQAPNLINGAANLALLAGEVAIVEHAGTEWFAVKS